MSKLPTRLEYSNGDVYEGALVRKNPEDFMNNTEDALVRAGSGKMIYANGDIYEVDLFMMLVAKRT
jgi:hypothetical protein